MGELTAAGAGQTVVASTGYGSRASCDLFDETRIDFLHDMSLNRRGLNPKGWACIDVPLEGMAYIISKTKTNPLT